MPLDAITIKAVTDELSEKIVGGRIDKVQQPERSMLLISLRSQGENMKLLLSAGTGTSRVQLTKASYENPQEPPMFCMLMRKHLIGAHIVSVEQPDNERMMVITLDCYDELGVRSRKRLIAELIGRSSNVILVGEDGRIIDCMRRMDFAGDATRRLLPGMIYKLPPVQPKTAFLDCDGESFAQLLNKADRDIPLEKWLMDTFSGLSPLICRELSFRSQGSYDNISASFQALREAVIEGELVPTMLYEEGKARDFSFMCISQYGSAGENVSYDSFSELLDAFYSKRDREQQQRRRSHELTRSVKTARDRLQRKLALQREEFKRTENREQVRINAELITANIYRIKKGDRTAVLENYYEEDCPEIRIELDPLKSPQENAALLFKEYNKLKGAYKHLSQIIDEGEKKLDYLNSVLDELDRAASEKDLADIRRELAETGFIRKIKKAPDRKVKEQLPHRYMSDDGYEILAGRSNSQNDQLTCKLARRTDFWLHAQKIHGSHVIIRCDGLEPPESTLLQAASIAAYHSQGREAGKIPVDFTMVRNVKKPSGALPGKVIYTDYSTLMVSADEKLAQRLADNAKK